MKQRKIPMRKDVLTGEMFPKRQLVRVVRDKEMNVSLDPTGKKPGRGAYVQVNLDAVKAGRKQHVLEDTFGVDLTPEFYAELEDYVDHLQARQELIDNDKL